MTKHKPTADEIKRRPFTRSWTYSANGYVRVIRTQRVKLTAS